MSQPRIYLAKCSYFHTKWALDANFGTPAGNGRFHFTREVIAFTAEDAICQLKVQYECPDYKQGAYAWQDGKHLAEFRVDEIAPRAALETT